MFSPSAGVVKGWPKVPVLLLLPLLGDAAATFPEGAGLPAKSACASSNKQGSSPSENRELVRRQQGDWEVDVTAAAGECEPGCSRSDALRGRASAMGGENSFGGIGRFFELKYLHPRGHEED